MHADSKKRAYTLELVKFGKDASESACDVDCGVTNAHTTQNYELCSLHIIHAHPAEKAHI